jgi:PilZ domain
MGHELKRNIPTRRYVRVRGPFDGYNLGLPQTPVLVYDLNLGGGFVNFGDEQPSEWTLTLKIDLPQEGPIMVNAETVYRHQFGVAVRFVDMDADTAARLVRTVAAFSSQQAPNQAAEPFNTNLTRCH